MRPNCGPATSWPWSRAGCTPKPRSGWRSDCCCRRRRPLGSYAEPAWAHEHGWPQFADRLLELARAAQPGSDHQLAFVNTLCSSVLSPRHVVTLADLLDHDPADLGLAGLEIDTDLRWRIVTALASAGEIDADGSATPFIDAEVQRDPTAAGKRHGAQAAAARPQPQSRRKPGPR